MKMIIVKATVLLSFVLFMQSCAVPDQEQLVYVGTYTGTGSEGIYAFRFNPVKGELSKIGLVAKTDNPSFLVIDPAGKFLYAVNELDTFQHEPSGAVSLFSVQKESGALGLIQQIPSLGAAPCHLSLDKSSRNLLVANYNGGNIAVFPVRSDGKLGNHSALIQDAGASINPDRQKGPHAHCIQVTQDNKFALIADLGIDQVLIYRFDESAGSLAAIDSGNVKLNPGSGPRHLAFAPSGKIVYVLNELTAMVSTFSWETETGRMRLVQTVATLPDNFTGMNTAAEIAVHPNGRFLYVSNRGADDIGIFTIDAKDGKLTLAGHVSSGGKSPRNFEIDPTGQWLLAANQLSNNLVVFRIDAVSGKLEQTMELGDIYAPVCVRILADK